MSRAEDSVSRAQQSHSAAALLMQNEFGEAIKNLTEIVASTEQRMKDNEEAFNILAINQSTPEQRENFMEVQGAFQ